MSDITVVVSSSTPDITEVINIGPAGTGGGTSYDQSLNTTDSPTFVGVNTASGTLQGGVYPGFFADGHGFEMTHGDQNQGTIDVFAPTLSSGRSVSVTLPSASGTLAIGNQSLNTTDSPTFHALTIVDADNAGSTHTINVDGIALSSDYGDSGANLNAGGLDAHIDSNHGDSFSLNGSGVGFKIGENTAAEVPTSHYGHGLIEYTTTSAGTKSFTLPSASGTLALTSDIPAQVQTDWNASSGLGVILNKPSLSSVATSGSASDLSTGTLPNARLSSNVVTLTGTQTLTNKSISAGQITGLATVATSGAYSALSGTPSLATVATSGSYTDLTGTSSVVTTSGTQTLSNKTLNTPFITSGSFTVILACDAGGYLSQRNSTTSQAYQVFNTFTDTSNYERGVICWKTNANALTIGTQKAGTGTARRVRLNSSENIDYYISDSTRVFQMATGGNVSFNPMTWQYYSGAGDPTTGTTPWNNGSGYCALWRNTTTGVVKLWVNNAGTMVSVALA